MGYQPKDPEDTREPWTPSLWQRIQWFLYRLEFGQPSFHEEMMRRVTVKVTPAQPYRPKRRLPAPSYNWLHYNRSSLPSGGTAVQPPTPQAGVGAHIQYQGDGPELGVVVPRPAREIWGLPKLDLVADITIELDPPDNTPNRTGEQSSQDGTTLETRFGHRAPQPSIIPGKIMEGAHRFRAIEAAAQLVPCTFSEAFTKEWRPKPYDPTKPIAPDNIPPTQPSKTNPAPFRDAQESDTTSPDVIKVSELGYVRVEATHLLSTFDPAKGNMNQAINSIASGLVSVRPEFKSLGYPIIKKGILLALRHAQNKETFVDININHPG